MGLVVPVDRNVSLSFVAIFMIRNTYNVLIVYAYDPSKAAPIVFCVLFALSASVHVFQIW